MLKQFLLGSAAALALAACGGPDHVDPGYTSTAQVYCNETTGRDGPRVVAACLDDNDLPVTGGCYVGGNETPHVALEYSMPIQWDSHGNGTFALWECQWTANGQSDVADGTPVIVAGGMAYICCVPVP
jgi:hypothetical protein